MADYNKGVIDIENGCFSSNAGIVEIGIIVIDDNMKEIIRKSWILNRYFIEGTKQPCVYSGESIKIHGITAKDQEKEGMRPVDVIVELEAIIQDHQIMEFIGHNARKFDIPRLEKFFQQFSKYEYEEIFPTIIDTQEIAKENFESDSYSLKSLCELFEVTNENPHRTLGDCEATWKLLIKMNDEIEEF